MESANSQDKSFNNTEIDPTAIEELKYLLRDFKMARTNFRIKSRYNKGNETSETSENSGRILLAKKMYGLFGKKPNSRGENYEEPAKIDSLPERMYQNLNSASEIIGAIHAVIGEPKSGYHTDLGIKILTKVLDEIGSSSLYFDGKNFLSSYIKQHSKS